MESVALRWYVEVVHNPGSTYSGRLDTGDIGKDESGGRSSTYSGSLITNEDCRDAPTVEEVMIGHYEHDVEVK